jgi:thioredoxin 1
MRRICMTCRRGESEKCARLGAFVAILWILVLAVGSSGLAGCRQKEPAGVAPDTEVDTNAADTPGEAQVTAGPAETEAERAPEPDAAADDQAGAASEQQATSLADGTPHDVTAADFEAKVLRAETPVLVDFWAEWCGPCRMMEPILESLAEQYKGKLTVTRIDLEIGENRSLGQRYNITAIPRIVLFKDGEIVGDWTGVAPDMEEQLAASVDEALAE